MNNINIIPDINIQGTEIILYNITHQHERGKLTFKSFIYYTYLMNQLQDNNNLRLNIKFLNCIFYNCVV